MPGFKPLKGQIWLGFDIETRDGVCPSPNRITFWKEQQFKNLQPEAPFHFKADALVGLSLVHLNSDLQNPFATPGMNFSTANQFWLGLEPHHELYSRCQPRVSSLRSHLKAAPAAATAAFQKQWTETLASSIDSSGIEFETLENLIECIDILEEKCGQNLLYNFSLQFPREMIQQMHHLYSLLFHVRTLCAMDYNAHVTDPTHQAIKVDSVTDYLSRADYVANDAVLYYQFKKLKDRLGPAGETLAQNFDHLAHHACSLVENLPKSFLHELPTSELEEAFYLAQMDWLLGTEAGLLFRIREELFGLVEGYDKIFWPELEGQRTWPGTKLSVNCLITEKEVFPKNVAA